MEWSLVGIEGEGGAVPISIYVLLYDEVSLPSVWEKPAEYQRRRDSQRD